MKIAIAGTGYVGLSNAMLLAQHNEVIAVYIVPEKFEMLNNMQFSIANVEIEEFLKKEQQRFAALTYKKVAYKDVDLVIIATPSDYDVENNSFSTSL